jgi:hypothetical protein
VIGSSLAVTITAVAVLLGVRERPDVVAASSISEPPDGSVLVSRIAFGSCTSKVSCFGSAYTATGLSTANIPYPCDCLALASVRTITHLMYGKCRQLLQLLHTHAHAAVLVVHVLLSTGRKG